MILKKDEIGNSKEIKGNSSEPKIEEESTTTLAVSDDDFLFSGDQDSLNIASNNCSWVIESDTSYHITSQQEYLSTYTSGDFGSIRMENNGSSQVIRKSH